MRQESNKKVTVTPSGVYIHLIYLSGLTPWLLYVFKEFLYIGLKGRFILAWVKRSAGLGAVKTKTSPPGHLIWLRHSPCAVSTIYVALSGLVCVVCHSQGRFALNPRAIKYSFKGKRLSLELIKGLGNKSFLDLSKLNIRYHTFKPHDIRYGRAVEKIKATTMDLSQINLEHMQTLFKNPHIKNVIVSENISQAHLAKLKEKFKVFNTNGKEL